MHTDKHLHQLFAATPDLLYLLRELPVAGPSSYESVTQKEVEHRLDGLHRPADSCAPELVVENQFYPDKMIYQRTAKEVCQRWLENPEREVRGLVIFAHAGLDPRTPRWCEVVDVLYLDEALKKLAQRDPEHPALAVFAPLLVEDRQIVAKQAGVWHKRIRESRTLSEAQRARYEEVFFSWVLERLDQNWEDLNMLITDLPALEETRVYGLILAKGKAEGKAEGAASVVLSLGRRYWGPEPEGVAEQLRGMDPARLEDLVRIVPDLAGWEAFREKVRP